MRCKDSGSLRITDLWTFRSTKSNKRYIVEVEGFDHVFYGLKFYWKGVELSKNRYSLLTNDFEPRKIVRFCIEVMLEYYRANKLVSFGFVASPDLDRDIQGKNLDLNKGSRRFLFYQRMMINLFGTDTFFQVSDTTHTIYLMINNLMLSKGIITINEIADKINRTYMGDYTLE